MNDTTVALRVPLPSFTSAEKARREFTVTYDQLAWGSVTGGVALGAGYAAHAYMRATAFDRMLRRLPEHMVADVIGDADNPQNRRSAIVVVTPEDVKSGAGKLSYKRIFSQLHDLRVKYLGGYPIPLEQNVEYQILNGTYDKAEIRHHVVVKPTLYGFRQRVVGGNRAFVGTVGNWKQWLPPMISKLAYAQDDPLDVREDKVMTYTRKLLGPFFSPDVGWAENSGAVVLPAARGGALASRLQGLSFDFFKEKGVLLNTGTVTGGNVGAISYAATENGFDGVFLLNSRTTGGAVFEGHYAYPHLGWRARLYNTCRALTGSAQTFGYKRIVVFSRITTDNPDLQSYWRKTLHEPMWHRLLLDKGKRANLVETAERYLVGDVTSIQGKRPLKLEQYIHDGIDVKPLQGALDQRVAAFKAYMAKKMFPVIPEVNGSLLLRYGMKLLQRIR